MGGGPLFSARGRLRRCDRNHKVSLFSALAERIFRMSLNTSGELIRLVGRRTITLDHGPIPEVNWPAMTMTFKTTPAVTGAVKVGDKVGFDVKVQGGAGEVTAIRKL